MKRRFPLILAAVLMLVNLLVALVPQADKETLPEDAKVSSQKISFAEITEINDAPLRDNMALYENDDPYDVITMYLTVQKGNPSDGTDHTWEEINSHSAYYYDDLGIDRYKIAALLQVGDDSGPLPGLLGYDREIPNAFVQIRGQTSSRNPQKNYKIELYDNAGKWNGQKTISLNKHQTEGMRFRNKLAFDLMVGIPQIMALRTQFVHLYVRDLTADNSEDFVDYGLYTQVEQLNKQALRAHNLDRNGQLYKVESCEFFAYDAIKLVTDPNYDQEAFEKILEIKGNNDHSKLLDMLRIVNDYSISPDEVLDTCFDRENLSYWMAFMLLIGNVDTQNRNAFIYSPLNSNKWYYIPWDNDVSLIEQEKNVKQSVDFGDWERGISNYWGNMLFRRALMSSSFREQLDNAINDLRQNYLTEDYIREIVERYAQAVIPYIFRMPDIYNLPLSRKNYELVKNGLADEIQRNYDRYLVSLKSPMPFYVGLPIQNGNKLELMWDSSYDMMNSDLKYNVTLAADYEYKHVLYEKNDIPFTSLSCDLTLEPGQYFLHVDATNSAGYKMNCFDCYVTSDSAKVYGTYCFYVKENGTFEPYVFNEAA